MTAPHNHPPAGADAGPEELLEELREQLIDVLDDQRMGDNVVGKKLIYKDIEWIIDQLLPVIRRQYLPKTAVLAAIEKLYDPNHRTFDADTGDDVCVIRVDELRTALNLPGTDNQVKDKE